MAETIGVVASAISILTLLEHIIDSIDKIKALQQFINTASSDLQDLIEEIEIVQAVLISLRPETLDFLNLPSTRRRLNAFQNDLEALILEISKYKDTAGSRKLGAVKVFFKRETLRTHRQNLDNIKNTLVLLQQAYCSTSLRELTTKFDSHYALVKKDKIASEDNQETSCHQVQRNERRTPKSGYKRDYRFRTPLGFMDKMWTISTNTLYSGWTFTVQVHNIIPFDSPVFLHCENGEIEEVQRLFSNRLASPFDCDPYGKSLLHVAADNTDFNMCRLLLESGADPRHRDNEGYSPLQELNFSVSVLHNGLVDVSWLVSLYRLFISDADDDLFNDHDPDPYGFQGPAEALTMIQNHSFEQYAELPLELRFKRAMAIECQRMYYPITATIRIAMGGDHIEPAAYLLETDYGHTLFTKIVQGMASAFTTGNASIIAEWRLLLLDAISSGSDLSRLTTDTELWSTPLLKFVYGVTWMRWLKGQRSLSFDNIVRIWASELKLAGVDLIAYGGREQARYASGYEMQILSYLRSDIGRYDHTELLWCRVLWLEYGPEPEDWRIWVTNPVDELVGQFWEMINRSLEVMPGTWID
ncbi:hypothetical protein BJX99DRAFT_46039 [Aspergillus californicus]